MAKKDLEVKGSQASESSLRGSDGDDPAASDSESGGESGSFSEPESDGVSVSGVSRSSKRDLDISLKAPEQKMEVCSKRSQGVRQNAPEDSTVDADAAAHNGSVSRLKGSKPPIPDYIGAVMSSRGGAGRRGESGPSNEANQQMFFKRDGGAPDPIAPLVSNSSSILKSDIAPPAWMIYTPAKFQEANEAEDSYTVEGIINLDDAEAAIIKADYEFALVGRVACSNFQFDWLASQIHAKWGDYEEFNVIDLGQGCFLLSFANSEDRDEVWFGGPWHIAGKVVGLDQWTPKFVPSRNPQILAPTWVRIPGLPLLFWGEKNLRRIAAAIGEPIYIDAFTKSRTRGSFARICVRRNLAAPLLGGIWLNSQETGKFFQKLTYEGMDPVCTACGFAGHEAEHCKVKSAVVEVNIADPSPRDGLDGWTCIQSKKPQKIAPKNINNARPAINVLKKPQEDPKPKQINLKKPQSSRAFNKFDALPADDDSPDEASKIAAEKKQPQKSPFHQGESSKANLQGKKKPGKSSAKSKKSVKIDFMEEDLAFEESTIFKQPAIQKKSREDYLADDDEAKKKPSLPRKGRKWETDVEPSGKKSKTPRRANGAKTDDAGETPTHQ